MLTPAAGKQISDRFVPCQVSKNSQDFNRRFPVAKQQDVAQIYVGVRKNHHSTTDAWQELLLDLSLRL
jgi:hypothetical protein